MPRRPKNPADDFSHNDLAIASGMNKRVVQLVADNRLLPGDHGNRDMKRICAIGAFVSAGASTLVAGRLVQKLLWSFNQNDGEMPSGLSHMALGLDGSIRSIPPGVEPNDFWYHRDLFQRQDIYKPGASHRSDVHVEIADREHVYLATRIGPSVFGALAADFPSTTYEGWIEGWGRGTEPRFYSLAELSERERERANARAVVARTNVVGLLTINASLAIRNGFDRLARHRGLMPEEVSNAE